MPTLEDFILPASPVTELLDLIKAQLLSVKDNSTPPKNILMSVEMGLDAVLQSAIDGTPSSDEMPLCRIFYDPHTTSYNNSSSVALFQNIPISLYFLFAIEVGSGNFQQLREDFIRLCLDYLKYDQFSDNIGMIPASWWKWNMETVTIVHNTDIKYLGSTRTITPESNFSCSRVDLNVMVKNYKSATDGNL